VSEKAELMRLEQELQGSKTKVRVQKREITSLNARVAELIVALPSEAEVEELEEWDNEVEELIDAAQCLLCDDDA